MLYELHLTAQGDEQYRWKQACAANGTKPLLIALHGGGAEPFQLMNASTTEFEPDRISGWVEGMRLLHESHGFFIKRVKLEVPLDKGIGTYDDAALYHECHAKLLIHATSVPSVVEHATEKGWVASRNLFYQRVAGLEKWYLTQRAYATDAQTAAAQFKSKWDAIGDAIPPVTRMEMETVIMDTNPDLDVGWA